MPDSNKLDRLFGELATADLPVPAPRSVVARGRQRRRRARGQVLAGAAAAVALLGFAASELTGSHAPAQSPANRYSASTVCRARPDPALSAELQRALPTSGGAGTTVIALSTDGATAYVLTTIGGSPSLAEERVATGVITKTIAMLPPRTNPSVQGGLGPDGELVWTVTFHVPGGSNTSTVLVWSPRTLAWSPVGHEASLEPAGQHGEALSAPVFSGRSHQLVAWESSGATDDGPAREIVEADLVTGVTDVVASGYVGAPVFVGDVLVWPVASSATGPTHLVAANASAFPALQPVAVPASLRQAGSATVIASSGGATVYASTDLEKLFYSPSPSQPARQLLHLPSGSYLVPGGLAVSPGYLAWNISTAASYVASARTLAAARITDGTATWGGVQGVGSDVLASRSDHAKSGPRSLYLLSGSVIDGLACTASG